MWEESWQTRKVAEEEEGGDEQEERAKPKRGGEGVKEGAERGPSWMHQMARYGVK